MAGTRKFKDPAETDVKLTLLLPEDVDRQLRALAARRGIAVDALVRGWISAALSLQRQEIKEIDEAGEAEPT